MDRRSDHADYVARIEQALFSKGRQLCRGPFRDAPQFSSRQRRDVMPQVFFYIDAAAYVVVLMAWGAAALGTLFVERSLWHSLWFLGVGLALLVIYYITAIRYDRRLKFRIAGSQIGNLLLEVDERLTRIYQYMPAIFGYSILGPRARQLEDAVQLVAVNADWYLGPPRRAIRLGWLASVVQAALAIWIVFSWQYEFNPFALFYSVMLALYTTLLWVWEQRRQAMSLNRFWEFMEWRFNLDHL